MSNDIQHKHFTRSEMVSELLRKKALTVIFTLILLSAILFIAGLSAGSTVLNPLDVVKHLTGAGSGEHNFVIHTLRLPRMLLAMLAGAALGVAGLIMQGVVRNPLGSPDIIGVTGGASFAAVFFLTRLAGSVSIKWLPIAAIVGAAAVSALIYALAWRKGVTPVRLVLVGIGLSACTGALTTMMIVMNDEYSTTRAYLWMTGSVYGAKWSDVYSLLPWVALLVPLSLLFAKSANVLETGDETAAGLGVRIQLHRIGMLAISVALAGAAVAFAGGIGFVGLIAPHIARKLVGRAFGYLVPVSALIGSMMVALADVVARTAFLPLDIPAGVFVSGIGAPFFIYLLYRSRHQ
ncbi:FecCD family ABC transporter permease [Paenibacillus harenae]|uniref:Iron complex transport system permease protein n=1 Tax=Paenibacillus harenae TaxID=306543 RepID=A0ABT9UA53_PAEHA|nr:iron ABC transporter permease [Paenibacillus harenae]MDQ0115886.1 iron complex transport system permease protein [Paenibacillus harenae]